MTVDRFKRLHLDFGSLLVALVYNGKVEKQAAHDLNKIVGQIFDEIEKVLNERID